ncbi:hypothetical protein NM90_2209 [Neisseria meningitidis NM90]|nr:hypothetical protein NM90_2209 [Neisseria meningitidis NM90]
MDANDTVSYRNHRTTSTHFGIYRQIFDLGFNQIANFSRIKLHENSPNSS